MDPLPYVDEHSQRIDAPADEVWTALLKVLRRAMGGGAWIARILGCDPARGTTGFDGRPGEAVPGFRVVETDPGRRLVLRGRHRFSSYALTFFVEGDRLRAQTHAAFPGVLGWLYRAAVIGTGSHGVVTRRLLRQVADYADARRSLRSLIVRCVYSSSGSTMASRNARTSESKPSIPLR
jgi:hypothetical protein